MVHRGSMNLAMIVGITFSLNNEVTENNFSSDKTNQFKTLIGPFGALGAIEPSTLQLEPTL